jgi:hypothetical protein
MNNETELKNESREARIPTDNESRPRQGKRPWITPLVSTSPVNELTAATFILGPGGDAVVYS